MYTSSVKIDPMEEIMSFDLLYADEGVPEELYKLVKNGLSSQLDDRLSELSNPAEYLTALSWHNQEQLSLLMVAALNGYDEIVRILFAHCDPKRQVELKGRIFIFDKMHIDGVTALYCACFRSHFIVAKTLLELGQANVNQDTHCYPYYPLLIHAGIMNRLDIVVFLIENGYSDVNETKSDDRDQCTVLIWTAMRGHTILMKYLIEKGADVNHCCKNDDLRTQTPLLTAASRDHVEAVQLLCDSGANTSVKSHRDETLLMIAAQSRAFSVINLLLQRSVNTVEDLELLACSLVNVSSSMEQMQHGIELLRLALQHRHSMNIPKVCIPPIVAYEYEQECQSIAELDSIKSNNDRLLLEILLVRERILLPRKDKTLMGPLVDYGEMLVYRGEFDKCLDLWIHAFYLYQQMDMETILHRFVWLFCRMIKENRTITVHRFIQVCRLTFEPSQNINMDLTILNALCLIVLATKILEQQEVTRDEQASICCWIHDFCRQQRTASDGQTLIHFCVDEKTNQQFSWRRRDIFPLIRFPNESALQLLLACGRRWLDLDAVDSSDGNTPLHLICSRSEDQKIIKLLVNNGAHVDPVNKDGKTPVDDVKIAETRAFLMSKVNLPHLKCLCARLIANKRLDTVNLGPTTSILNMFVSLHGGSRTEPDND